MIEGEIGKATSILLFLAAVNGIVFLMLTVPYDDYSIHNILHSRPHTRL